MDRSLSSSRVPAAPARSQPYKGRGTGKAQAPGSGDGWGVQDIRWPAIWAGYAVATLVTLAAGLPLLAAKDSTWLLAASGSAGLLAGGLVTGKRAGRQLALLNGALLCVMYNVSVAGAFFIGSILQLLPEPLPGLPQGDSTFFFAWPLAQFVLAVAGAAVGSRMSVKRKTGG
ncbi:MAG: hypothetical protein HY676_04920 [Chloroflexi bacterium]|nr:hypothetical protein [Chloroflexota bacterium]